MWWIFFSRKTELQCVRLLRLSQFFYRDVIGEAMEMQLHRMNRFEPLKTSNLVSCREDYRLLDKKCCNGVRLCP